MRTKSADAGGAISLGSSSIGQSEITVRLADALASLGPAARHPNGAMRPKTLPPTNDNDSSAGPQANSRITDVISAAPLSVIAICKQSTLRIEFVVKLDIEITLGLGIGVVDGRSQTCTREETADGESRQDVCKDKNVIPSTVFETYRNLCHNAGMSRRSPQIGPLELPVDYRHAYVQLVEGHALAENDLPARALRPQEGRVVEAAYVQGRGIFERFWGVFSGKTPRAALTLMPPFDFEGADRYGLFANAGDIPPLEPQGAAVGQVRRVQGRLISLSAEIPPDGALLRDYWLARPPALHACEAVDLAICSADGPPVVFSCEQSPLLIGRPTQVTMSGFLSRVGPRMRALLRAMHVRRQKHEEGQHVVMTAGQMVEALFVVHAEVRGTQEFLLNGEKRSLPMDLVQNRDPYRGSSNLRALVGGDAPGMRAVVRVVES